VNAIVELIDATPESERSELEEDAVKLLERWNDVEFMLYFSGTHDASNCYLTISGGAGGTDAQDWAEMLVRMYLRYCERKKWKTSILEKTHGQEAGIKSATIYIEGELAYGHLKAERGTHRLVRLSPFNSKNLRQTSFALVEALPEIESADAIDINPADLRIDTYRASGAGGQHVNKTDSAVRLTHAPTGIVVACQNERSQAQNKEQAMKILQAKLLQKQEEEEHAKLKDLKGTVKSADFGQQIRSYVLHPYKMVKDLRTEVEKSNPDEVLDGDIEDFIIAELRREVRE
jgi:peptide chain release factor 2